MGFKQHLAETEEDFLIYLGDWCPYCVAAKNYLTQKQFTFRQVDVDRDRQVRMEVVQATGNRTIPVIFDLRQEQPIFVGGFDDLSAYL